MSDALVSGNERRRVEDWSALWRQMVEARYVLRTVGRDAPDYWAERASSFDLHVKDRWNRSDATRDELISRLTPEATLLDIGAGPGTWAVPLARHVRHVTAIEPSPAMAAILRANLADRGIGNVTIVEDPWPEASVEAHDFVLSSHAIYGIPDLPRFVQSMVAATKRRCFLIVRGPDTTGIVSKAAEHIWGHPDAILGLGTVRNVLLQMGIAADVVAASVGPRSSRGRDPAKAGEDEEALAIAKRWLAVAAADTTHDRYLAALLEGTAWRETLGTALLSWAPE